MLEFPSQQSIHDWAHELPAAVTVSNRDATIIYMNEKSASTFAKSGGNNLIGSSLYDCHNPASSEIIRRLLAEGGTNTYTIEKNGVKKLIFQSAWFRKGEIAGLVEISIILPPDMPHFIRD